MRITRHNRANSILMLAAMMMLSGCTLMPGSHIRSGTPERSEDAPALADLVRTHAIDAGLFGKAVTPVPDMLPDELRASSQESYAYLVGPGDVLNITVWGHPELTIPAGSMRSPTEAGNWVHADGSIFYPHVGSLEVAGKDVATIRAEITARLRRYIESPQVDVTVAAFRSQRVYVTGAVNRPGPLAVTNVPMYLLDAIAAAGDLAEHADWQRVVLNRDGREFPLSLKALIGQGDMSQNVALRHGDVVHVARNDDSKVFVLGEVRQPQQVMMDRNGLSLAGVLSDAGGINELSANARGIFVLRRGDEDGEARIDVFQLDARNATALVLADQFVMQPRDIVYVTAAPIARWNRVISNLLPTVNAVYLGVRTERDLSRP
ncbi:MAG: polysaccharide export protein [Alcanivoracaceae bacterium]